MGKNDELTAAYSGVFVAGLLATITKKYPKITIDYVYMSSALAKKGEKMTKDALEHRFRGIKATAKEMNEGTLPGPAAATPRKGQGKSSLRFVLRLC